jgi:tetratricopeptide (TPR) repeat protein
VLEYAYQYHEKFPDTSIYWIYASNVMRFEQDYLRIARNANLPGLNDPNKDTKELTKDWLESKESGTWLMIVDNADDAEIFFGAPKNDDSTTSTRLAEFLPQSSNGSIVFTTRNNKVGVRLAGTAGVIFLPEMDVMDGHNLVKARLGNNSPDESPVTELLQILGYLPLAISQATAYIAENLISITEYIQMYNESEASKIDLLSQDFEDLARESGTRNPVATTWLISIDQIKKLDSLAVDILSYMACLDRQGIPKALLPPSKGPIKLANALGLLKAYSLITGGQNSKGFDMHPLVYLATRNWLRLTGRFEYWVELCLSLVAEVFPTGEHNSLITCDLYLSHAQVLLSYEWLLVAGNLDRALLAYKVSWYEKSRGKYNFAETLATQALEAREKVLGAEHLDTLTSVNNLASVLMVQGKFETAQELHYRALVGREKALGKEHLDTLTSIDNLAWVLERQDKLGVAEAMTRQALERREKALGKEHPDNLSSMDNLAWVLNRQNKHERAEEIAQQTLKGRSKVLGKEHPSTLTSTSTLASILSSQSKHEAAEEMY